MITECPQCRTAIGPGVVKCPKCAELFFENAVSTSETSKKPQAGIPAPIDLESFTAAAQTSEKQPISPKTEEPHPAAAGNFSIDEWKAELAKWSYSITDLVAERIERKSWTLKLLVAFCIVASGLCVYWVFRIQMNASEQIEKLVAKKFGEAATIQLMQQVAETEASRTIRTSIQPSVMQAEKRVQEMQEYFDTAKEKFDAKYDALTYETKLMENRRAILGLAEQALSGYRKSYEALAVQQKSPEMPELTPFLLEQLARIHQYFQGVNRFQDVQVTYLASSGQGYVNESVPTSVLISELNGSPHWKIRAKAAQLLSKRIEKMVPDALLHAAQYDPFLDVTAAALRAFQSVTGYEGGKNPLDVESASSWWKENQLQNEEQGFLVAAAPDEKMPGANLLTPAKNYGKQ